MNPRTQSEAQSSPRNRIKGAALVVATLLAVSGSWQLPAQTSDAGEVVVAVPTARAEIGTIERVLRITGSTDSINAVDITAPQMQRRGFGLTLLDLIESGTMAKKGEIIATLDSEQIEEQIDNVRTNMENGQRTLERRLAEQQVALMNIRQDLRVAEADVESWKLEAGAAEVLPDVEQEIIRLALEEAEASYAAKLADSKLEEQIEAIDIRNQELDNEEYIRDLDRYTADLEEYIIRAPIDGMAVRQKVFRNGAMETVQPGDEMNPGLPFLVVMNMSNMEVSARVNQVESRVLRVGQEARIGLDAFPELQFPGEITGLGALAESSSTGSNWVRTIPVYVKINGTHERLLPDLSAHVDVILEREEDVLQVPLQAVFEEEGQAYVYVRQGNGFDKRPVTLGIKNYTHAAVSSGLNAGEEVAIQRPPGS